MKTHLIALCMCLAIAGCSTLPAHDHVVVADKPVAVIPAPPETPKFVSQVDKLVPTDAADPGKVGVAYKYDMTALREINSILEAIIDQYRSGSANFDKVNAQITALYQHVNGNPAVAPATPASAASAPR
jgi:hypothetical protein